VLIVEDDPAAFTKGGPEAADNDRRTSNGRAGQNGDQTGSASPTGPISPAGRIPISSALLQPVGLPSRADDFVQTIPCNVWDRRRRRRRRNVPRLRRRPLRHR
jgi:hypothetical protein